MSGIVFPRAKLVSLQLSPVPQSARVKIEKGGRRRRNRRIRGFDKGETATAQIENSGRGAWRGTLLPRPPACQKYSFASGAVSLSGIRLFRAQTKPQRRKSSGQTETISVCCVRCGLRSPTSVFLSASLLPCLTALFALPVCWLCQRPYPARDTAFDKAQPPVGTPFEGI